MVFNKHNHVHSETVHNVSAIQSNGTIVCHTYSTDFENMFCKYQRSTVTNRVDQIFVCAQRIGLHIHVKIVKITGINLPRLCVQLSSSRNEHISEYMYFHVISTLVCICLGAPTVASKDSGVCTTMSPMGTACSLSLLDASSDSSLPTSMQDFTLGTDVQHMMS